MASGLGTRHCPLPIANRPLFRREVLIQPFSLQFNWQCAIGDGQGAKGPTPCDFPQEGVMQRRNVLKSVVSAAAGAGLVAATGGSARAKTQAMTTKALRTPFIVTGDGAHLFYKD